MADSSKFELSPASLRWRCDPSSLGFSCTHEITAPKTFIGQRRAVSALEFGLSMNKRGYNIFVTGLPGTGKSSVIQSHIRQAVKQQTERDGTPPLFDWCYVYNFEKSDSPQAVRLPRGKGAAFARDVAALLETLRRDIPSAYADEAYKSQARKISEDSGTRRRDVMVATERAAAEHGFTIQVGPAGIVVIPIVDGKPLEQARFMAMSAAERETLDSARREVTGHVEEALRQVQALEQQHELSIADLDRRVAEHTTEGPFRPLTEKHRDVADAIEFLTGLRAWSQGTGFLHWLRSGDEEETEGHPGSGQSAMVRQMDPAMPFRVNLFVDNSRVEGPPIIVEDNPTYVRLFGQLERRATMGTYVTDHTMLKPGSLVNASGGYLVMDAREVLIHLGLWPALKRVLKGGTVRPEDPADAVFQGLFPQGLRPEAIPIDVKVVLSGEPEIYDMLSALDPDFWEIFKIHADLDSRMPLTSETVAEYARFICGACNERDLRHFDSEAAAAVIEHGARLVGDQTRLSTRFGLLVDLLVESSYWADRDGVAMVAARHVEKALEQKVYRSGRVSDAIQELMVEGTLIVSLEGRETGQVNGLAVYSSGDTVFGKPSRITASASVGREGVINIERESQLSGQTHDKGVLILAGFLRSRFAQDHPLAVNISIAFEQSYGVIDGDSASSTELYAVLSSLSGLPLRQDIAVTGSVNQLGEVQPIGGVNEKAEGFYDLCKAAGKLGSAGVVIPARNVRNLMLRPDVVEAVRNGLFHIYAVTTVDEGMSVLTGVEIGRRGADGIFPAGSVNALVQDRLREFADQYRRYGVQHG